jgi:hypothetical protein
MPACMAKNCNSGRAKEPWSFTRNRVVLYRFPKSPRISNRWIRGLRLRKWTPKPNSVVCSLHFEESCFIPETFNDPLQRPKLHPKAVPTIFDHGKKKTSRKLPKDRSGTPETPHFSSLLAISSENQQDVETFNDPLQQPKLNPKDVPTIFDHGKKKTSRKLPKDHSGTPEKPGFSNLLPISSENQQDVETATCKDDSFIIAGN